MGASRQLLMTNSVPLALRPLFRGVGCRFRSSACCGLHLVPVRMGVAGSCLGSQVVSGDFCSHGCQLRRPEHVAHLLSHLLIRIVVNLAEVRMAMGRSSGN